MQVRKWNILVHRYLGYYFFGLTFIYSVSGVAVNHMEEWNPSYISVKKKVQTETLKNKEDISPAEVKSLFARLEIDKPVNTDNIFYPSLETIEIIVTEGEKIVLKINENQAEYEKITRRPVLHLFNFLHLNEPKKLWSLYADIFAISLVIITVTGLFMKKGKEGAWGKGGIIATVGMVIPIALVIIYY